MSDIIFDEFISCDIARGLIAPEQFDPNCRYKLVTDVHGTTLIRINTNIVDDGTEETKSKIFTEYHIDSSDAVTSYGDMLKDTLDINYPKTQTRSYLDYEPNKRRPWWILYSIIAMLVITLILSLFIIY